MAPVAQIKENLSNTNTIKCYIKQVSLKEEISANLLMKSWNLDGK